jgi:hypothetical protein
MIIFNGHRFIEYKSGEYDSYYVCEYICEVCKLIIYKMHEDRIHYISSLSSNSYDYANQITCNEYILMSIL